ncbi:MAG: hypothetical protein C0600_06300 [Ignavibacteria bacterium]|nr:MAG: hypothetical protein C0600_06300 [Ignavibacteria bacterium]
MTHLRHIVIMALLIILVSGTVVAQDEGFPDPAFFAGGYRLVGKAIDSDSTFTGTVLLRIAGDSLIVERTVKGECIEGSWGLEYALGREMRVVRMRFPYGEDTLEATYQWHADFDNYPRLSGYLYRKGAATDDPGMEVLFFQLLDPD